MYITIDSINIVFYYILLKELQIYLQFVHLGWYIGLKSDHICKFKEKKIIFQTFRNKHLSLPLFLYTLDFQLY